MYIPAPPALRIAVGAQGEIARECERIELLAVQLDTERRRADNLFLELGFVNDRNNRLQAKLSQMQHDAAADIEEATASARAAHASAAAECDRLSDELQRVRAAQITEREAQELRTTLLESESAQHRTALAEATSGAAAEIRRLDGENRELLGKVQALSLEARQLRTANESLTAHAADEKRWLEAQLADAAHRAEQSVREHGDAVRAQALEHDSAMRKAAREKEELARTRERERELDRGVVKELRDALHAAQTASEQAQAQLHNELQHARAALADSNAHVTRLSTEARQLAAVRDEQKLALDAQRARNAEMAVQAKAAAEAQAARIEALERDVEHATAQEVRHAHASDPLVGPQRAAWTACRVSLLPCTRHTLCRRSAASGNARRECTWPLGRPGFSGLSFRPRVSCVPQSEGFADKSKVPFQAGTARCPLGSIRCSAGCCAHHAALCCTTVFPVMQARRATELQLCAAEKSELREQAERMGLRADELTQELSQRLANTTRGLGNSLETAAKREAIINELRNALVRGESELADARASARRVSATTVEHAQRVADLERELEARRHAAAESDRTTASHLAQLEAQLRQTTAQLQSARGQLAELEQAKATAAAHATRIATLERELEHATAQRADAEQASESAARERDAMAARLSEVETVAKRAQDNWWHLQASASATRLSEQAAVNAAEQCERRAKAREAELLQTIEEYHAQLSELHGRRSPAQHGAASPPRRPATESESQVTALRAEVEQQQAEGSILRTEVARLMHECAAARQLCREANAELERVKFDAQAVAASAAMAFADVRDREDGARVQQQLSVSLALQSEEACALRIQLAPLPKLYNRAAQAVQPIIL